MVKVDLRAMAERGNTENRQLSVQNIIEAVWNDLSDTDSESEVGDSESEPEIQFCDTNLVPSVTTNYDDDDDDDPGDPSDMISNVLDLVSDIIWIILCTCYQ